MKLGRRAQFFGGAVSLVVHGALLGYVAWRTSMPDIGFDFQLPSEVEFGLSEAVVTSAGSSPPPAEATPSATPAGEGSGSGAVDAGVPMPDAGPPDAGRRRRQRDAGPAIAQGEGEEGDGQGETGQGRAVAFLPAGSQIALRLDVARVSASPLGPDVRRVLSAMPDWQALLEGSGIEPLEDMDRLLIASPNLHRSRLIAAGRATGDEAAIRAAAERMAAASGQTLEWRTVRGVPVADWHDRDPTDRVIAILGPRHFVIAREVDVPRVIAVARARAGARRRGGETEEDEAAPGGGEDGAEGGERAPAAPREHPADALVSMEDGEGLSLEVEGFRIFAAARPQQNAPLERLPVRLRIGLLELPNGSVGARIAGRFEDAEQAEAAVAYWNPIREAYGSNAFVQAIGLGGMLSRMDVTTEGDEVRASVDIQVGEMRRLLNLVHAYFVDRAAARRP